MKIYDPRVQLAQDGNAAYCPLMLVLDEDRRLLNESFCGDPLSLSDWKPLKAIRSGSEQVNFSRPLGDRCGIDYKLDPMVLSRGALDVLLPHIGSYAQELPLDFDERSYSLLNITRVIDALDESRSELYRFPSSGRVGDILRYVFKTELVKDEFIFKIPQLPRNAVFVTNRFVEIVTEAGLTGFDFQLLWAADPSAADR